MLTKVENQSVNMIIVLSNPTFSLSCERWGSIGEREIVEFLLLSNLLRKQACLVFGSYQHIFEKMNVYIFFTIISFLLLKYEYFSLCVAIIST